jgi:hypothetical protein
VLVITEDWSAGGASPAAGDIASYVARMSLLFVSHKRLVVIKASVAKDAANLLRKASIELGKLTLGGERATKHSVELGLCSRPNNPSKRHFRHAIFVRNNKSRTPLRIM